MGILTSQLLGPLVHHVHKGRNRTSDIFRHSGGNFIGRGQQNPIEALLHGQRLSRFDADMGTVRLNIIYLVGKSNLGVQRNLFNGQHGRHNLSSAGRGPLLVNPLGIQNFSGIQVHQNCGFCYYLRPLRPSRYAVGLYLPFIAFRHGILLGIFLYSLVLGRLGRHYSDTGVRWVYNSKNPRHEQGNRQMFSFHIQPLVSFVLVLNLIICDLRDYSNQILSILHFVRSLPKNADTL